MNHIADVSYEYDMFSDRAWIKLKSPALEALYQELGFETRTYTKACGNYNVYEDFTAYLVRGVAIDNEHTFERDGVKFTIITQRCGNCDLFPRTDSDGHGVNISHIRGLGIKKGFRHRVKPLPSDRAKAIMMIYTEGVIEYYNCLKDHVALRKRFDTILAEK